MGASDLQQFSGGSQDKGIDTFNPDIGAEITWDESTVNVSGGQRKGVGPRYGIAPLPGHATTETPTGTQCNGLMKSESAASGQGLLNRERIFGIVPITMTDYDSAYPKKNNQYYLYLVGLDIAASANVAIDACLGATLSSSVNKQSSTIVAGLAQSSYREESPLVRLHKTEMLNLPLTSTPAASDVINILKAIEDRYFIPYAHISVSGKRIPYQWMFCKATSTPDATTAPSLNLWSKQVSIGQNATVLGGSPSEIITRNFVSNEQRKIKIFCLDDDGYPMDMVYEKEITSSNLTGVQAYGSGNNYSGLTSATKSGASTAYSSATCALLNDNGSYTNSSHEAVLVAGENPTAIVYQSWLTAVKGMMPRFIDLTRPGFFPREGLTEQGLTEQKKSGLNYPGYSSTAPGPFEPAGANTGIIRTNTRYEIGFSYYNKILDIESNVVYAADYQYTAEDYTALKIPSSTASTDSIWRRSMISPIQNRMPWEFSSGRAFSASSEPARELHINDIQYRFYYREYGSFEWLPAGNHDAAKFWFYSGWTASTGTFTGAYEPRICEGPVAGLPGGQPGGFIDYSPLPKQRYICVVTYKGRAFWFSEKTINFSLSNNIYAYPTRNIVTAPSGRWRGGIVHIQPGETEQTSRLVVFGDSSFVGRFTGNKTLQQVRISPDTVGQFEVDGSDFEMDYLCDATAFSYRSACVADGILYFWGPQGVYRDDGISQPQKISQSLEPDIFDMIDTSRDHEVHCVYNKRASEIIWFYPPKTADSSNPTYGLVLNTKTGNFSYYKFPMYVDASQNLKIENDSSPSLISGERIIIHGRANSSATIQRSFFFDDLVKAGQQYPTKELMIEQITEPSSGKRRLYIAGGSIGVTAGGIAAGDFIAIQNAKGWATSLTSATDMIAKIDAVSNASSYIDIILPDGASLDTSATLDGQTSFPVWHMKDGSAGLHGITYQMVTNYWLPAGLSNSWYWIYLYFLFKYSGIPTPADPFTGQPLGARPSLSYRTLVSADYVSDTLKLIDNSAGHCQIHHPLRNVKRSANGQALKYKLSGIHIGNPWTLEYLEAHCRIDDGFSLKEFEG